MLLLGRTGMGKSTTVIGNKILEELWGTQYAKKYFTTGNDKDSVTIICKVFSNNHSISVMDTPGFANTSLSEKLGVMEGNKQILQEILQKKEKYEPRTLGDQAKNSFSLAHAQYNEYA